MGELLPGMHVLGTAREGVDGQDEPIMKPWQLSART